MSQGGSLRPELVGRGCLSGCSLPELSKPGSTELVLVKTGRRSKNVTARRRARKKNPEPENL